MLLEPHVEEAFSNYRFKHINHQNFSFFRSTDAQRWSFYSYYISIIYSSKPPITFGECISRWTASLRGIKKHRSTPKTIVNFVEMLLEFNKSKEFSILRKACEQRFGAHLMASISSATVALSEFVQGNNRQAAEIAASLRQEENNEEERMPPLEVDYTISSDLSSKDDYTTDLDSLSPEDEYITDLDSPSPEDDYITESDSGKSSQVLTAMKKEIEFIYRKMETQSKWRLSTGKYVEDSLFDFGMVANYEHLAHSFIIDPDDETYNSIFTEKELDEIRSYNSKEFPEVPDGLIEYLLKYDKDSLEELREVLAEKESWEGKYYDKSIHFDFEWIKRSMHNLINEYDNDNLKSGRHENWYLVHFWSLIDNSLSDLNNVYIARGEVCSNASANRKNRHRMSQGITRLKRKELGRRNDLIIRKNKREYGCSEAGRCFKGENDTKILKERGLKCPKVMKDMFVDLANTAEWNTEIVRQIEVVGWIHAELMMMLMRLDNPSGYICRITRTPLHQIAEEEVGKGSSAVITRIYDCCETPKWKKKKN
ncbi:10822_t:CDS:2 [Funneliformis caledonium]|uniref:10822_t:CDS:1 n=1 Tax=Funneliformis caledonium TaxID=1117310 RepID=A0A9N8WCA6_9GLOM|nr:10822_t:CDS:2 [Funneliformis caledonium]